MKRASKQKKASIVAGNRSAQDLLEWLTHEGKDRNDLPTYTAIETAIRLSTFVFRRRTKGLSKKEWLQMQRDVGSHNFSFVRMSLYSFLRFTKSGELEIEFRPSRHYHWPLATALRMFLSGDLHKVRRCHCGLWFIARRSDQTAHLGVCRQRIYEGSARGKKRRREYMKAYYLLKKSGKVK